MKSISQYLNFVADARSPKHIPAARRMVSNKSEMLKHLEKNRGKYISVDKRKNHVA